MLCIGDGEETQLFNVHEDLMVVYSALIKRLATETDTKISLPAVRPASFEHFLSWVYTGTLVGPLNTGRATWKDVCSLAALWENGRYLECHEFQNFTLRRIIDTFINRLEKNNGEFVSPDGIAHLLAKISADTVLRQFLAHAVCAVNPFNAYAITSEKGNAWNDLLKS